MLHVLGIIGIGLGGIVVIAAIIVIAIIVAILTSSGNPFQ